MRILVLLLPLLAMVQVQADKPDFPWQMLKDFKEGVMGKLEEEVGGCLKVTPPTELVSNIRRCFKESLKININRLRELDYIPDAKCAKQILSDYKFCQLRNIGINAAGAPLTVDEMLDKTLISEWKGEDQGTMKTLLTKCAHNATGETALEQRVSVETCFIEDVIAYCQDVRNVSAGNAFPFTMMLLTMNDPEQCMGVRVPEEMTTKTLACVRESRKKMTMDTEFINAVVSESNKTAKAEIFFRQFKMDVLFGTFECMMKGQTDTYDPEKMTLNLTNIASYFKTFQGWSETEIHKREEIANDILHCGRIFGEVLPPNGEKRMEGMMRLYNTRKLFDQCMLPRLAKTCGIHNDDLAGFFIPMFNRRVNSKVMSEMLKAGAVVGIEHLMNNLISSEEEE